MLAANWKDAMLEAIFTVALREPEFTNDDVFDQYDKMGETYVNPDKRAYGSVVQKALKMGLMEWTGHTIVSRRRNCHSMLIRVYKSKVYEYTPISWLNLIWGKVKLWFGGY